MIRRRLAAIALAAFIPIHTAAAIDVSGPAQFHDADTVTIAGQHFRLGGIDAPELKQQCWNSGGRPYACGWAARDQLVALVAGRPVRCLATERDRYRRWIGQCFVAGTDLQAWLAMNGWAMAYRKYSSTYVPQEDAAHQAKRGIWAGTFDPPWIWRHRAQP